MILTSQTFTPTHPMREELHRASPPRRIPQGDTTLKLQNKAGHIGGGCSHEIEEFSLFLDLQLKYSRFFGRILFTIKIFTKFASYLVYNLN